MKRIFLISLLLVAGVGAYWFTARNSNTGADICASRERETGAFIREVVPGGFKVQFAVWDFTAEDGVPVINYAVLLDKDTAFCEFTTSEMLTPGTFIYLDTRDSMPLDARGFPKEGITVTASKIRIP